MKAGRKMDYLGMLGFSCIFLGGSMLIGLLAWLVHCWWIARLERKEREAAIQQENDEYAGLHHSLLLYADEMIRKVDK